MNNDLLACPLCDGWAKVSHEQLIRILSGPTLSSKVERVLSELKAGSDLHPEVIPGGAGASDFETQVYRWNPAHPMWKRSPKE
jgi:hypothetical protein